MSNMREIRERIKSINDIMKITNAMYLISSSKLKKAKKDLAATEPYFDKLLYAMRSILSRAPEDIDMRFFDTRTEIPADKRKKHSLSSRQIRACAVLITTMSSSGQKQRWNSVNMLDCLLWDRSAECIFSGKQEKANWTWMRNLSRPPRTRPCTVR